MAKAMRGRAIHNTNNYPGTAAHHYQNPRHTHNNGAPQGWRKRAPGSLTYPSSAPNCRPIGLWP